MNLNDIIFEYIDDNKELAYGKYLDFKLIIHVKSGYINVSKLCSNYSNKKLKHWLENKNSIELINEVNSYISLAGYPANKHQEKSLNKCLFKLKNETIHLKGTYVHPLLVPHIAGWISPQFAIKVSRIVNEYASKQYLESIREKNTTIDEQNKKIDEQTKQIKELLKKADKIINQNDNMQSQLEDTNYNFELLAEDYEDIVIKFDEIKIENEEINNKLDTVSTKLGIAVETRVVPLKKENLNNVFVLLKIEDSHLYVIRCQHCRLNRAIDRQHRRYPNLKIEQVLKIDLHPNSINLYNHIKNDNRLIGKITFRLNHIYIINNLITINELKLKIVKIHEERKNIQV